LDKSAVRRTPMGSVPWGEKKGGSGVWQKRGEKQKWLLGVVNKLLGRVTRRGKKADKTQHKEGEEKRFWKEKGKRPCSTKEKGGRRR